MKIRQAPFAVRVVRRNDGDAAILYQRVVNKDHKDRLTRLASLSTTAFASGSILLRQAAKAVDRKAVLKPGPFLPLDADWGARVACYALVSSGLRDGERLFRAADTIQRTDPAEAAWWLGVITNSDDSRPVRALRILVEAVP